MDYSRITYDVTNFIDKNKHNLTDKEILSEIDNYILKAADTDSILEMMVAYADKNICIDFVKKHIDLFYPSSSNFSIFIGLSDPELIQIIFDRADLKFNWKDDIKTIDFYKRKEIIDELKNNHINLYRSLNIAINFNDNENIKQIYTLIGHDDFNFHFTLEQLAIKANLTMIKHFLNILKHEEYYFSYISEILKAIDHRYIDIQLFEDINNYIELENYIIENENYKNADYTPLLNNAFYRKDMEGIDFLINKYKFDNFHITKFLKYLASCDFSEEIVERILLKYSKLDLNEPIRLSFLLGKFSNMKLFLDYSLNENTLNIDWILKRVLELEAKEISNNAVKILIEYGANIQNITKIRGVLFKEYPFLKDAFKSNYSSLGKYIYELKLKLDSLKSSAKKSKIEILIKDLGIFPDLKKYIIKQEFEDSTASNLDEILKNINKNFNTFWNLDKEYYENEDLLIYAANKCTDDNFFEQCFEKKIKCLDNPKLQLVLINKFGYSALFYDYDKYIKPKDLGVISTLIHKNGYIFNIFDRELKINITKKLLLKLIETHYKESEANLSFKLLPKRIIEDNSLLITLAQKSMLNVDVMYNLNEFNEELTKAFISNLSEKSWYYIKNDYQKFQNFVKETPLLQMMKNDKKIMGHLKQLSPSWNI